MSNVLLLEKPFQYERHKNRKEKRGQNQKNE